MKVAKRLGAASAMLSLFVFNAFPVLAEADIGTAKSGVETTSQATTLVSDQTNTALVMAESKEQQKQQLMGLLVGTFSNFYPSTRDPDAVANFPPVVQRGQPLQLESGEQVLLMEQRFLHESTYFRRQIYRFVVQSRRFSDEQTLLHYTYDVPVDTAISKEQPIQLSEFQRLPGCEVRWVVVDHGYEGYRDADRCYFVDEDGASVYFESQLRVELDRLQVIETLYDQRREPIEALGGAMVSEPIRFFDMSVKFLPAGANSDNDEDWITVVGDRRVHDHGQRINLRTAKEQQLLPYQIHVVKHYKKPDQLMVRVYALGDDQPMHQWQLEEQDGRWYREELPLRVELIEATY